MTTTVYTYRLTLKDTADALAGLGQALSVRAGRTVIVVGYELESAGPVGA